jgi:hypothetical protein
MTKKPENPYRGEQARGWQAFHDGVPMADNPFLGSSNGGHANRWREGWTKAKMAQKQGKRAM